MSRSVIAKLFFGSLVSLVVAVVLLGVALAFALGSGSLLVDGANVVGIQSAFGWGMVVIATVAIFVIVAAAFGQLVAWIGALINTAALENKTWFVILLVTGLLGFGVIAMLVYLLTEPNTQGGYPPAGSRPAAV